MKRQMIPWSTAVVSGPSMVPTLLSGDVVLASRRAKVRKGDVVLARYRSMPERLVVKRAERVQDGGWWLASDNAFAGGDSARHGVADVEARVLLRLRRRQVRRIRRRRHATLGETGEPRWPNAPAP